MQPNPTFEVCPMEMILTFTEGQKFGVTVTVIYQGRGTLRTEIP